MDDDQIKDILMQLESGKLKKLVKELEGMNDEELKELIEFLKSFVQ